MLSVEHLSKTYDMGKTIVNALNDVSFEISDGAFVAITGASGSGKSTLLHIIGGVDSATSGRICIDDTEVTSLPVKLLPQFRRAKVSIVYQFYNLLPMLNVKENISIAKELNGETCSDKEISEVLSLLGMEGKEFYYPNQLSGGQQQRVAIARALIAAPSILLADEPTGNLDSVNAGEIFKLLRKANLERKQTIIMVTHDKRLAESTDRIIELQDGRIIKDTSAPY